MSLEDRKKHRKFRPRIDENRDFHQMISDKTQFRLDKHKKPRSFRQRIEERKKKWDSYRGGLRKNAFFVK